MHPRFPCSDYLETRGVVFFARLLSKIRLHAAGKLPTGYHLGLSDPTCFDARFCRFWEIDFEALRTRTLAGGTDEEVFDAIFAGRTLNPEQVQAWNGFLIKRGWRDSGSAELEREKASSGMGDRADVQTFVDLHDVEEGRPLRFSRNESESESD